MDFAWRLAVAAIGIFLSRGALYRGVGPFRFVAAGILLALTVPLATAYPASRWWVAGIAAVWLFPIRPLGMALLRRAGVAGGRAIAKEWGVPLKVDGDLWEAVQGDRERWMGNVLTRVRSIHPAGGLLGTYYMLAFSMKLASPPRVTCSVMRGWTSPKYFETEWRQTTVMQGEYVGLSLGDALHEGKVATGGKAADLKAVEPHDPRLGGFTAIAASDEAAFREVFSNELLESFLGAASRTFQFEMNVTPTRVNVYTTYCGVEAQKGIVGFLEKVREVVGRGP